MCSLLLLLEVSVFTPIYIIEDTNYLIIFSSITVLLLFHPTEKDATPFAYYTVSGILVGLTMVASNLALKWVTYPMQVIFKSAKPISVMFINLFMCKRYTIQRYVFVMLIVVGVVLFKLFESKEKSTTKKDSDEHLQQWYGIGVLTFSLAMDGLLGALEDKVRHQYKPSPHQMMVSICGWGSAALLIAAAATTEIIEVFKFASRHPTVLWQLGVLGLCGATGQLFIFTMIACFGALSCSVTTTVRKFISVIFSIIFFGNPSTPVQWGATVIVFGALLADAFFGKKSKKPTKIEPTTTASSMEKPTTSFASTTPATTTTTTSMSKTGDDTFQTKQNIV